MKSRVVLGFALLTSVLSGCATAPSNPIPVPTPLKAATPTPVPVPAAAPSSVPAIATVRYASLLRLDPQEIPAFEDDLDTASLHAAALQSMAYYQSLPENQLFILGADTYTARDLQTSMATLAMMLEASTKRGDWLATFKDTFAVYQSVGVDADRTVTFSSYYEPTISARLNKDKKYKYPLYARPGDLVDVDLALFEPAYQGVRVAGRRDGRSIVPYATRADIDSRKVLSDQGLEIAWAKDPLEILDLQIEGSGWLDFGKGRVHRIRYDGDNGHRYRSVGQYLISTGRIPAQTFTRQAYLKYLKRHPEERQELLNVNERYIFFRIDVSTGSAFAYGNIDVPLTPWRSIATDPKLFPKGALAWISVPPSAGRDLPLRRFMLNQDQGGAIQGAGRVDVFAGHGKKSKLFATHLWNKGKLYFLVKKKS